MIKKISVFILLCIFGIVNLLPAHAVWPIKGWARSTPAEQNLNPDILKELIELIREGRRYPDQHSLLIVRNGYLVVEEYFNGYSADKIHMLQSVSKSFTSAVMGIAIHQGWIKGVNEKVLDFFKDVRDIKNMDNRKKSMRLKDLLTMRSGTDYHEGYSTSPHSQLNKLDRGWDRFYLNRPMVCKPGTRFLYDSGGVILMSAMLKNRCGKHVDQFAEKYLFAPLGIKKYRWFKNRESHPHTGGGLHLRPQDMAKFGLLYLRNGRWGDKHVVPLEWVKESFKKHVKFTGRRSRRETGYGYLWWIQKPDPEGSGKHNIYSARGAYGQFIFVIPEHSMVVVVTGKTRGAGFKRAIDFLYSHILPSVNRNK
jgi:CubicO group peptidase (beta-lactamase class C family)